MRSRALHTPLVVAAVAVVATGTILVVQSLADAGGCSDGSGVRLRVAADPAIAPAVRQVAQEWVASEEPQVDGGCVGVDVTSITSADAAGSLATAAGGFVDVATPSPREDDIDPAVWVPDSTHWLSDLQSVSRSIFEPDPVPLASSPVVLGATQAGTELLGEGPVAPADLREPVLGALAQGQPAPVRLTEPRRDTAGLVGAGWLQQAVVTSDEELPNVVAAFRRMGEVPLDTESLLAELSARADDPVVAPISEQALIAYQQGGPLTPLATVPVTDAPALDFPYAVLARQPLHVQQAATLFRNALLTPEAVRIFGEHGFRTAEGATAPIASSEQLGPALRIWASATRDARVLSVVNVNASMAQPLGPVRRIDVFRATAQQGLELFTANSQLGHWEYAAEWSEGVPIDTLTDEHKQAILGAIGSMQIQDTDESALFETLLAAYQEVKEGYDRDRSNTLILWTDGGNNQPGGLTLEETLRELERLADVTRPIRVVLLGLGPDANMADLQAIAEATGGGAFQLLEPDEISLIFLKALLT